MSLQANVSLEKMAESRSLVGELVSSVDTPAFVVHKRIVERNCEAMLSTCRSLGVRLRAQTKTHKTVEGLVLQTGGSRSGLVCSTLAECEFFAGKNCEDILLGHPLTQHHMARVTRLTGALQEFHVMVDCPEAVQLLQDTAPPPGRRWSAFLKVDCGKGRAGVWHEDVSQGVAMVRSLLAGPYTTFKGVYVHCGDTYAATSQQELADIRDNNIARILRFVEQLESATGVQCQTVGVGSTPSCRQPCGDMSRLTELHPGNYVFLDVQQHLLGSCGLEDIAVTVATRVVGHYPRRNQMLVDCGFTALTKQGWGKMSTGYGVVKDHPHLKLCAMDQEHGFIEPLNSEGDKLDYSRYPIGSMLFILPYHSCATAAMHSVYLVVDEGKVVEEWRPTRGW